MTLTRNLRFFALLLALSLVLALTGCDKGEEQLFPEVSTGETTQSTQVQNPESEPSEPPVQELPAYAGVLSAVQCYYQGQLQREYTIAYDEQGVITTLHIYTYDKGSLYSWGENRYEYDERGNLTVNDYTYSLGTQRWEYVNSYDEQGVLTGCQVTEYYNGNAVSRSDLTYFYDDRGRYQGTVEPYTVSFDEYGRILSSHAPFDYGDIHGETYAEYDYSWGQVIQRSTHTAFPEYEQFSSDLRVMLNRYHVLFGLDMKEGYQTITDSEGRLSRVTDENGSDVFVFIYQ